ncbi:aldehyde dehydrogenase family protein [Parvularcula sp. LCG005]|uniref:aldehyde dehydrogenase family protein n=1 Tax=Parvularcula sp. LCG005 TaxID=3078805 RepID=UPI002942C29F|nr:aldehyde dehydrogenase family protein [Parvularcula sp. LCG005]WOI52969.1 aldehyde dehydrogenase family protein [Parvularcula sp. LCG005]
MTSPLKAHYPYYLGNKPVEANQDLEVTDKYTGEVVTRVALADVDAIDRAIGMAADAAAPMAALKPYQRRDVLEHCTDRFRERADELAEILTIEAGKPVKDSRGEVTRLIETFRMAAGEAERLYGEVMPLAVAERAANYQGQWKRVPIGPCSFISPFNFPLNLTAHKIAPAIAAGCPFVLKPASLTPIGALMIGEVLAECDLPEGAFSILPARRDGARLFSEDDRLKLLSFTGSAEVGWKLKANAGKKPVVLELGGNAAVVFEDGDMDDAVDRIMTGGFYQSGQSCISVQRVLIRQDHYDTMRDKLVSAAKELTSGNPEDDNTFIGPIISDKEADRIMDWIEEGRDRGASVLCGGERTGNTITATVLENVPVDIDLYREEVFGPVILLEPYDQFDDAIARVNDSRYGLQAGVFTRDIYKAHQAWDDLHVGGVIINDVPSWRVDHMPYGGVKDSGLGREGLRFSIEDMTEIRLMVLRTP